MKALGTSFSIAGKRKVWRALDSISFIQESQWDYNQHTPGLLCHIQWMLSKEMGKNIPIFSASLSHLKAANTLA